MANDIYQLLQSNQVRFLRLLPDRRKLAAQLEIHPLREAGSYIALSYTWGNAPCQSEPANGSYEIRLNNQRFRVQENLYDALTYLAPRVRNRDCLLWVDAICINQNDVEERSTQILHMAYLYKHAIAVYGWIGVPHDEEEIRLAIALMKRFHLVLRDGLAEHNDDMNKVSTTISPDMEDIFPATVGSECYKGWLGIKEMWQRSYWQRTWVYQEATHTPDTPFFCGNEYFTMTFVSAAVYMAHHFSGYPQFPQNFCSIARGAPFAMSMFRTNGVIRHGDSLLDLLEYFRTTECSEPRDKVYAILGMAVDLSSPPKIIPDYSKSLWETYSDVVRFSLSHTDHGLQILGHVTHPASHWIGALDRASDEPSLPSWVPDYRRHGGSNTFCTRLVDSAWAYNACGARKVHNARIDDSRLIVTGFYADEIVSVSEIWEHDVCKTAEVQAWAPVNPNDMYHCTGQTRDEAFRTTVFADMNVSTKSRGHMADWNLMNSDPRRLTADESSRRNRMEIALKSASGCRRLCWTTSGRMGLVPATAQAGDLLFVLLGGQMIHILRRNEAENFKYVGESYVHGIMDGELVPDEGDLQRIVLE